MDDSMHFPGGPAPDAVEAGLSLRDRLDRCQSELVRVRRRLSETEAARRALEDEAAGLQVERAAMARLYVACLALHGTLERDRVLGVVEDLLINLAATEEFGVYELAGAGEPARLVRGFGIDAAARARLEPSGVVAASLASGEPELGPDCFDPREPANGAGEPVASLPLAVDGRTTGVVAVWSFLPQKPGPEPGDAELYALLSTHVAVALRASAP